MNRLLLVNGVLGAAMGTACMPPVIVTWLERGALEPEGYAVVALGFILVMSGMWAVCVCFRRGHMTSASIPAPVRAVIAANVFFLAFCALETSDGLLRQGGRIFYWTSLLFIPALVVLYGQVLAHCWAWWVARTLTAMSTFWFVGFIALIPFVEVRGSGGAAVPWWGRVYMAAVTLVFAGVSAYAFHALGRGDARRFFSLAAYEKQEPCQ